MNTHLNLSQLGWRTFFQQQVTLDELETTLIARVIAYHRDHFIAQAENGCHKVQHHSTQSPLTVGDWLLLKQHEQHWLYYRLLERLTVLSRKGAGSKLTEQLIAANIDTLFIVSSHNKDFNLSRFERYLALAHQSGCTPVVVLTKRDQCEEPEQHLAQLAELDRHLIVLSVNALDNLSIEQLRPWCSSGQTVAFVGSSGVGKSSLVNGLSELPVATTAGIREDDSKGRHTTTHRALHVLEGGALLLDTPGVRELQLADCQHGVELAFSEISELAEQCRFADCYHQQEPGCKVQQALQQGRLTQRRLDNYHKLLKEQQHNARSLAQLRSHDRSLGRFYRNVQKDMRNLKGR
ncbi:MAG: ribosome small subunit-dependent GTPase A [Pseudoalteromonas prydzensis]|uniref:Small ribosomal subunit biogenesis GTPase RsgA n=1 Tax=Pseudoalteromonas prydzensis TaxID=182141 RepID=A0ABR9FHN8_9GAMM|nr:ribosome small subunit-dependent GTPase A [Pseudoalteromonas prydzensis]MBE0456339.1 ribosome small subunit-dependent GTPase A [Pseudoalteromonas prydzensis]